jgi:hypothetical protein
MLAINVKLGYARDRAEVRLLKLLRGPAPGEGRGGGHPW